jgi:hypothetical protein
MVIPLALARSITTPSYLAILRAALLGLGLLPLYGARLTLAERYGTKLFCYAHSIRSVTPAFARLIGGG